MIPQDFAAYKKVFPEWYNKLPKGIYPRSIAVHSPCREQIKLLKDVFVGKNNIIEIFNIHKWDLMKKPPSCFDVIILMNVFFYVENPMLVLSHLMKHGSEIWIQDIIKRKRSVKENIEHGDDGDNWRFLLPNMTLDVLSPHSKIFNLGEYKNRILDTYVYDGGINNGESSLHFLMKIKGNV